MIERRALALGLLLAASAPVAAMASGGEKKDAKEGGGAPYIELPTLTATAIRPGGRRGVLTVQATLNIADPAKRERATKYMPKLIDAYVVALQTWVYQMVPGALPNVELMSRSLQQATDRIIGPGARVLLGGVMIT